MKLLNKKDEAGRYVCSKCGVSVGAVGFLFKHLVYCKKCFDTIKGKRDARGIKIREVSK